MRDLQRLGERLLNGPLDPVMRYRMLRDVLGRDVESAQMRAAHKAMLASPQVRELAAEQVSDGSWGRLHSRDTRLKRRRILTTEAGVERGVSLGLTRNDPILSRARRYLTAVVRERAAIPDPPEKNDRWAAGVELFAGATLARFDPENPVLDALWLRWAKIAQRAFASGRFDANAEIEAHRELHGVRDGVAYLTLSNRYAVALLGARRGQLPAKLRKAYARWLWALPHGLGYISVRCWTPPSEPKRIAGWMRSVELISRIGRDERAIRALWMQSRRLESGSGAALVVLAGCLRK
jgi:hypothetical protein